MLTIDFLAKRYGKLPSEVMSQGTTFDLYVSDTAVKYQNWLYEKEQGNNTNTMRQSKDHGLSQQQMKAMIERTRSKHGSKS